MRRVLAVDDNPRNLLIIDKALDGEFELVTAASGEEALEIAPRFRPDVVLLDIMMPGIDGHETCRRLRAMHTLAASKIIMVSARATTADRLEGYTAGANDYLTKPFDPDELLAKLRVYIQLKSIQEVDHLKSDLLGMLGHETRTPLTAVLGPAAILLEDPTLTADQLILVEMIRSGGLRLLSLVEKVAYLTRLKAGLAPPAKTVLASDVLVGRAVEAARERASRTDVAIEVSADEPIQLEVDPGQLKSALEMLVDNALRLSPPASTVRIDIRSSGPWAEISVRDLGPGIAPAMLDRVFDEFATEDLQSHSRGHGLSLATARLIVEQHGGNLVAESEAGHGATFRVLLPSRLAESRAA